MKILNADGKIINDDHEDLIENGFADTFDEYHVNPKVKTKDELVNSDIILSVRHLKQFFFFGSGPNKAKLKAVSK